MMNIRSFISKVIVFVILSTAFAGCDRLEEFNPKDDITQESSVTVGFRDNVYRNVSVGKISDSSRMVFDSCDSSYDGIADNSQPFDGNTIFFSLCPVLEGKVPQTYTGYIDENGQQVILCGKKDCGHTGVECPAYINMRGDYFTLEGKLYFYSPEYHEYGDDPMDGTGKRIRLFTIDQNGKSLFCEMKGYTGSKGSTVITDGQNLYLVASKETIPGKDFYDTYVVKIDMQTGEYIELVQLDKEYTGYKLSDITADGKQIIFTAREKSTSDYVIGVCTVDDGKYVFAHKIDRDDYIAASGRTLGDVAVVGRKFYSIKADNRLTAQVIGSPAVSVLFEDLTSVLGRREYFKISHTFNDKLVITRHINDGQKYGIDEYYAVDVQTLEITPLTLIGQDDAAITKLYRIYTVTPDYFLVATNPSEQYNSRYINDMAVISKADFYSNNHNLQPVGAMYVW